MHPVDWTVVVAFTVWIVYDGLKRTKDSHELYGYFLAKRSIPWWAAGLSVMATQLSAITMIGTTGQGFADGMRFIQFYFGLPLAMIVLSVTLVPYFYNSGVYTAYETLERRFDAKTRSLTSLLFLISRGMSVGAVVSAPAVVLSLVLGWNLTATALAITAPAVVYSMFGGVQAVTWTDVKTMALTVFGLFAVIATALFGLPDGVSVADGFAVAAATGRLRVFDFSFDITNQYTFWSGTIAALFLFCSYFGTDQSQVQRYLTARSVDEARHSLLMSAYWKIPLQVIVLLLGVLVFVFYAFNQGPMIFSSVADQRMRQGPAAQEYTALESEFDAAFASRRAAAIELANARDARDAGRLSTAQTVLRNQEAALQAVRTRATDLVRQTDGTFTDVNYVIPTFILTELPVGLIGLLIVTILMAATDTIAGELNSLSTATVIDFYRRWIRPTASDAHYLATSKIATGLWGLFACAVAVWAAELGSLIEVVNRFGSFFYGSILGVFILALGFPRATANGAFVGLIAGMASVAWAATFTNVAFLWHNVIGVVAVLVVGMATSAIDPTAQPRG
ncbi:MAG: sodium:solute symporter [Acidobacteria bacterium RIFCSPLOWO2_12_FULL_65_11]|nr:MAG: sodium:solute symporter [Acidobacteria bacterium RIFCSPLOWO2_12_FULL_65_11]